MPEGDESYWVNSATKPNDRYEYYVVKDLIVNVENRFPVAPGRVNRAIIGVSMGGFGAMKLAFSHPDLFVFAGGISSAIDVPRRPFSVKRIGQWQHHRSIVGSWNSEARKDRDPLSQAQTADPSRIPFLYLSCGNQEGLLPANRQFDALLTKQHIAHTFTVVSGGHDWNEWNRQLPNLFQSLSAHVGGR
jgi:putative tributyrin esterase